MTAKQKKNETAKQKKNETPKADQPFFTMGLVGVLFAASLASGLGTYYYMQPPPKIDPHKKNPNVVRMRSIPKDKFKAYKFSKIQQYQEDHIFPYIRDKKNQTPIKDCYFGYKGKFKVNPKGFMVVITFKVMRSGKIADLGLVQSRTTLKEKPILECILKNAYKWKFKPHKMKPFTMRSPFFFR